MNYSLIPMSGGKKLICLFITPTPEGETKTVFVVIEYSSKIPH